MLVEKFGVKTWVCIFELAPHKIPRKNKKMQKIIVNEEEKKAFQNIVIIKEKIHGLDISSVIPVLVKSKPMRGKRKGAPCGNDFNRNRYKKVKEMSNVQKDRRADIAKQMQKELRELFLHMIFILRSFKVVVWDIKGANVMWGKTLNGRRYRIYLVDYGIELANHQAIERLFLNQPFHIYYDEYDGNTDFDSQAYRARECHGHRWKMFPPKNIITKFENEKSLLEVTDKSWEGDELPWFQKDSRPRREAVANRKESYLRSNGHVPRVLP